jgi:hypothetical protein
LTQRTASLHSFPVAYQMVPPVCVVPPTQHPTVHVSPLIPFQNSTSKLDGAPITRPCFTVILLPVSTSPIPKRVNADAEATIPVARLPCNPSFLTPAFPKKTTLLWRRLLQKFSASNAPTQTFKEWVSEWRPSYTLHVHRCLHPACFRVLNGMILDYTGSLNA